MSNSFSELNAVAARCHVHPNIIKAICEGQAKSTQTKDGNWSVVAPDGTTGTIGAGAFANILQQTKTISEDSFAAAVKKKMERGD